MFSCNKTVDDIMKNSFVSLRCDSSVHLVVCVRKSGLLGEVLSYSAGKGLSIA
jgi:hypothetical protein